MDDRAIVLVVTLLSSFFTWKMVKDFYITKFHMLFAHIIAIMTATFMFVSIMLLFASKEIQTDRTKEVEFSFEALLFAILMTGIIYFFFKYLPSRKKK